MTQCPNGSQAKPAAPAWSVYTSSDVTVLLGAAGGWLPLWVLGLEATPFDVATFCATEPTGDLPTAADYVKLATPPLALISGTYQRFANQLRQDKWDTLCQCAPVLSPTWRDVYQNCTTNQGDFSTSKLVYTYHFATGDTNYRAWCYQKVGGGAYQGYVWLRPRNSGGYIGTPSGFGNGDFVWNEVRPGGVVPSNVPFEGTHTIPAGATDLEIWLTNYNAADGVSCYAACLVQVNSTAGPPYVPPGVLAPPAGFPSPPAAPTCTTDQDICNAISKLSNDLALTQTFVRVLQSQVAPFGYLTGASHTGLTGNGVLAVSGILGVAVVLTSVPSTWGQTSANPRRLLPQVGEIHFGNSSYNGPAMPLHYDDELLLAAPPLTSEVVYSLRSGVTATITEILRS